MLRAPRPSLALLALAILGISLPAGTLTAAPRASVRIDASGLPRAAAPVLPPLAQSAPTRVASGADGIWYPVPVGAPPPPPPTLTPDMSPRYGHAIVYASKHQRFVVFGGLDNTGLQNDVWSRSLSSTSYWELMTVAGTPPSPRYLHSAVYDSSADRILVFGGDDGALQNDLWELDLAGTPTWNLLTPSGTPPAPRSAHSAVFDAIHRRMVVFGGKTPTASNELWFLDCTTSPPTWELPTLGAGAIPYPRSANAAIFDDVHDWMVIYGGVGQYFFGDVWTLSLSGTPTWVQRQGAGGPGLPREGVTAAFDPANHQMLVSSGDLWGLDLNTFTWTQFASGPLLRNYAAFALDPLSRQGIFCCGFNGSMFLPDTWAVSMTGTPTWTQLLPPGLAPPPPSPLSFRYAAAGVYDPLRDRFMMIGGAYDDQGLHILSDVAKLQIGADSEWVDLLPSTPFGPRTAHGAVYDPVHDRVLVLCGYDGSYLNDVWAIVLSPSIAVSSLSAGITVPRVRDYFSAIYDPLRQRIVLFGGNDSGTPLGDIWALNLSPSLSWTQITPAPGPAPVPRMLHDAIYDPAGDRMVVFGGFDGSGTRNDLWALSLGGTPTWTELAPTGTPPAPRYGYSLEFDPNRQRAILFGGVPYGGIPFNDVWALTLGGGPLAWTRLFPGGTGPSPRYVHLATYDGVHDRMLVSGGASGSGTLQDVWRLQFSSDQPTATLMSLLSSDARSDGVTLTWGLSGDAATYARLERRQESSAWRTLEETNPGGAASLKFVDHDVVPGARYAYRLTAISGAEVSTSAEVWVDVPAGPAFSLAGFSPNPATREARVSFSLADRTPATIEVVDVSGRMVVTRRLDAPTPGVQTIAIAPDGGLSPGLYFVRLSQGSRSLTTRGAIVR